MSKIKFIYSLQMRLKLRKKSYKYFGFIASNDELFYAVLKSEEKVLLGAD